MRKWIGGVMFALGLWGCGWTEPKTPAADERRATQKRVQARQLRRACGSPETYARLKAFVFDEATKIRRGGSSMLDTIASHVTVRMEDPVAKSRDEALDVTVCEGRFILELPPGLEDAFDGDRRLQADVEYAAQAAVDGSGLVYQMQGAEPIIYRLAAMTLGRAGGARVAATPPAAAPTTPEPEPERSAPMPPPTEEPVAAPRPQAPPPPPRPVEPPPRRPEALPAPERQVAVARPSFNCRVARGRVERMVCADADLARLDRQMSSGFYAALARGDADTRAALRGSRDRWLAFRNRCSTAACVAQAYRDRMDEIADMSGN
jgi:uncharacterized protein YecT (DUF1311 family)